MDLQSVRPHEVSVTEGTFERPVIGMSPNVVSEMPLRGKRLVAEPTLVRFFPCMSAHVGEHVASLAELLLAYLTLKRLFPCVGLHVVVKRRGPRKVFVADRASVDIG